MDKQLVQSKGINWVRFDEGNRILEVEYASGSEYRYFDVPPEVYEWLLKARSKGKFMNRLVKDRYRYERVGAERTSDDDEIEELLRRSLHRTSDS